MQKPSKLKRSKKPPKSETVIKLGHENIEASEALCKKVEANLYYALGLKDRKESKKTKMKRKEFNDKIQSIKEKFDEGMEIIKNTPFDYLSEVAEFTEWAQKMDESDCDLRPYMETIFEHYRVMADTNPEFRKGLGLILGFLSTSISQKFPDDFHALFAKLKALSNAK